MLGGICLHGEFIWRSHADVASVIEENLLDDITLANLTSPSQREGTFPDVPGSRED